MDQLLWKAFRTTLKASDLYPLSENQISHTVSAHFNALSSSRISLLRRLWAAFYNDIVGQGGWAAVNSLALFAPPLLIRSILVSIESPELMFPFSGWLSVIGLLISGIVAGTADCQCDWIGHQMGARVRAVLTNEIYVKTLRKVNLPLGGKHARKEKLLNEGEIKDGSIFNLMSVDTEIVSDMSGNLYPIWVNFPLQITIGTWLLYSILGISGVIGVLLMVALFPLNFLISRRMMAVQARMLNASDTRIKASNEMLSNIRLVKYSAWESPFIERILEKRRFEMKQLRSHFIWWSVNATTFRALPLMVTVLACFFYTVVCGNPLETAIAFPALTIFGILHSPLDRMARSIASLMEARTSLSRIETFLQEIENKCDQLPDTSNPIGVGFSSATLAWPTGAIEVLEGDPNRDILLAALPSTPPFRLESLDIKFKTDCLNVICGPSGSGKSSLLLGLLGEMELIKGHIFLHHDRRSWDGISLDNLIDTTAYCPQDPWIMNRTLRTNIVLDLPFDGRRYEAVLHAVSLIPDISALKQGDQTLAGENGGRLSGGQKQRIALARVLYSPSKYVLLDDCLSAIDSHTANRVFFHAIKGSLMKGRTCILATHHMHLTIPHCDYVVMLENGRVVGQGTAEELASMGLIEHQMEKGRTEVRQTVSIPTEATIASVKHTVSDPSPRLSLDSASSEKPSSEHGPTHKESMAEGAVTWSVIRTYLTAMGAYWYWTIIFSLFGLQQVASLGTNIWVKQWAVQYDHLARQNNTILSTESTSERRQERPEKVDAWYYTIGYVSICISYALITFTRDISTFYGSIKASSKIYKRLLGSITYAKFSFFDQVPFGQITNRLTKDVQEMDQLLAGSAINALQLIISFLMVIVFISASLPSFLPISIFICLSYSLVGIIYINGARDLKRIESIQRSPLYQQFRETIIGSISIRAFSRAPWFAAECQTLVDQLNQAHLLQWAGKAWLTFRVDVLSSWISFFTGAFMLWNSVDTGDAGLVLAYSTTFTKNVMWFVQVYGIIQQNLNSVERIMEFTDVSQETDYLFRAVYDIPQEWPAQGEVRFENFSTRYAPDLDPALKEVTFGIHPGERVAIVGRTGAGKSTLILALLRGLPSETGRIMIDGVDIASVPLRKLRQVVTVLPQDLGLLDGTLRDSLDPLQNYTDEEMIAVLQTVRLYDINNTSSTIRSSAGSQASVNILDQNATALSRGQRQLLCIARALLRRSRILVLDEPTASIDHAADAAIQALLRTIVARGTTIITIAHRLLTIADYDKIVVLDAGRVVEQGSVRELLIHRENRDSMFRRLCEESGDLEEIERLAAGEVI
jgi:ABC-type multidrug transport system fused ATPase/permease subunit